MSPIGVTGGCELSSYHARGLALAWRALFASPEPILRGKKVTSLLEKGKTRHNRTEEEEVQQRFESQPLTLTLQPSLGS